MSLIESSVNLLPHICFVAVNIYPVLVRSTEIEFVGGAEVQQTVQIRALRRAGFRISVLVKDHGQPDRVEFEGVSIYKIPSAIGRGIPGTRFIAPRLTDVVKLLKKVSPDIVYVQTACDLVAAAAWYAKTARKRFVFAGASDPDFQLGALPYMSSRDSFLYRAGLRAADGILVQNAAQKQMLEANYKRDSLVMQNCYEEPEASAGRADGHVIWAATVKPLKRPDLYIELARRFPHRRFVMVGGAGVDADSQTYYEQTAAKAREVSNLEFVGYVPYARVGTYFDGAAIASNTSDYEGFPNTFLQAWIRGVPMISFVRPEASPGVTGTIACSDLEDMASKYASLFESDANWQAASDYCQQHFKTHHGIDAAVDQYRQFFEQVCA
jgi:glycosyltransferase involved in cell wall biosynthesis